MEENKLPQRGLQRLVRTVPRTRSLDHDSQRRFSLAVPLVSCCNIDRTTGTGSIPMCATTDAVSHFEMDFDAPLHPEDLLDRNDAGDENHTKVCDFIDVASLSPHESAQLAQVEQENFDRIFSLSRSFLALDERSRSLLLDCLCSNFSVLNASISTIQNTCKHGNLTPKTHEELRLHKTALKMYIFFLEWMYRVSEEESKSSSVTSASVVKSKSKASKSGIGWDWDFHREKVTRPVSTAIDLDLKLLFTPTYMPDEDILQICTRLAFTALGSQQAIKSKETRQQVCHLVGATALKYGQLETVTNGLVDLLNKHEHVPLIISEIVAEASRRYDDSRLAESILRCVGNIDPAEYRAQQLADAAGVRNVAAFIGDISGRLPHVVANCMATLMPHLGGEAYALRSALVTAMGRLISGAFSDVSGGVSTDIQQAKLKSKQALLDALVERARDVSSYTRARVMQTWAQLAEERAIPLSHWLLVTELGIGRLEDKSANVRKAALQLIESLLQFNPFSPELSIDAFKPSLDEFSLKLAALAPRQVDENALPDDDDDALKVIEAREEQEAREAQQQKEAEDSANQAAKDVGLDGGIESLKVLVASLSAAVKFSEMLSGALPYLEQLLASPTASDSTEAMALIILMKQFNVDNSESTVLKILPLVFSRDAAVKDGVIASACVLWLSADSMTCAQQLSLLPLCTTLGELVSLEKVIAELVSRKHLKTEVIRSLWTLASTGSDATQLEQRGALLILSMAAKSDGKIASGKIAVLLDIGFEQNAISDPVLCKATCILLHAMAPSPFAPEKSYPFKSDHIVFSHLVQVLSSSALPESGWYAAAQEAIAAIYGLHPHPEVLLEATLQDMACRTLVEADLKAVSAIQLSRFLFVLGQTSMQHLVLVESLTKAVRRLRVDNVQSQHPSSRNMTEEEEDIGSQIGLGGTLAEDMELDVLKEKLEAQIVSHQNLLGKYLGIAEWVCLQLSKDGPSRPPWVESSTLRSSAVLALSKLMTVHQSCCEKHLQLLFTIMERTDCLDVKCNVIIALGDLAFRFPNLLEPWTQYMYEPLKDSHVSVRKHTLLVLTHLILNDMMKVKGHISGIAECLEDDDPRIVALTQLFFHELAQRGHSPIYNLLPDILSRLSASNSLSQASFQRIMKYLLGFITKDKQVDSIVEKLCTRFSCCEDSRRARDLAYCMSQLSITEKGLKILTESLKSYARWLGDEDVWSRFQACLQKSKKGAKPETKASIEDLEVKLTQVHDEQLGYDKTDMAAKDENRTIDSRVEGESCGEENISPQSQIACTDKDAASSREMSRRSKNRATCSDADVDLSLKDNENSARARQPLQSRLHF